MTVLLIIGALLLAALAVLAGYAGVPVVTALFENGGVMLADGVAEALAGHPLASRALILVLAAGRGAVAAVLCDLIGIQLVTSTETALTVRHLLMVMVTMGSLYLLGLLDRACRRAETVVQPAGAAPEGPVVVFLRSFASDRELQDPGMLVGGVGYSEEQRLANLFRSLAPVVALALPSEPPELGAIRVSSTDEEWQAMVKSLVARAIVVVIRLAASPSVIWELRLLRGLAPRLPVLFVLPPLAGPKEQDPYPALAADLTETTGWKFPDRRGFARLMFFDSRGAPALCEIPTLRPLRHTLRRFFEESGLRPSPAAEPKRLLEKGLMVLTGVYLILILLLSDTVGLHF